MPENSCHNIGIDMICNIYHIANQRITPPRNQSSKISFLHTVHIHVATLAAAPFVVPLSY